MIILKEKMEIILTKNQKIEQIENIVETSYYQLTYLTKHQESITRE